MKIIFNPFLWLALGGLVFLGLRIAETPADSWLAAALFLPCFVMVILTGIGAFGKILKRWNKP